jgi:hypothetical protein
MDDNLMACVNTMGLNIISPDKIFIPHTYRMVICGQSDQFGIGS